MEMGLNSRFCDGYEGEYALHKHAQRERENKCIRDEILTVHVGFCDFICVPMEK